MHISFKKWEEKKLITKNDFSTLKLILNGFEGTNRKPQNKIISSLDFLYGNLTH